VTALVLGLMIWWFAIANRYVVFLYYHDMGPRVPDTRPFSAVTRSRYWMTGLVAGGAVMVLYAGINGLLGRLSRRYLPPAWWRVWAWSALPLAIGIPAITMTANSPTLPLRSAGLVTIATLAGLALALLPGRMAAQRPVELALLSGDGLSLALILVTLPGLEYLPYWLEHGGRFWVLFLVGPSVGGLVGLALLTGIRYLFRRPSDGGGALTLAGLCAAYLALPLIHHVIGTDGQFYITDMDNFFSRDPWIQLLTFALCGAVVWATTRVRAGIARRSRADTLL
jgi:hypothetical protein